MPSAEQVHNCSNMRERIACHPANLFLVAPSPPMHNGRMSSSGGFRRWGIVAFVTAAAAVFADLKEVLTALSRLLEQLPLLTEVLPELMSPARARALVSLEWLLQVCGFALVLASFDRRAIDKKNAPSTWLLGYSIAGATYYVVRAFTARAEVSFLQQPWLTVLTLDGVYIGMSVCLYAFALRVAQDRGYKAVVRALIGLVSVSLVIGLHGEGPEMSHRLASAVGFIGTAWAAWLLRHEMTKFNQVTFGIYVLALFLRIPALSDSGINVEILYYGAMLCKFPALLCLSMSPPRGVAERRKRGRPGRPPRSSKGSELRSSVLSMPLARIVAASATR